MKRHHCNGLQAEAIRRYHLHLVRLGRAGTVDQSAREWIKRYAPTWRKHHQLKSRKRAQPDVTFELKT